eukprot:COSAG06_NODE_7552_length_2461_cov_4.026672_2_plen_62_part_00
MGETTWCVRGTQRWVHWEGLELKVKGTNPQWSDPPPHALPFLPSTGAQDAATREWLLLLLA